MGKHNKDYEYVRQETGTKMDGTWYQIQEWWYPRVSWFRPPCILLFRWAYHVEKEQRDPGVIAKHLSVSQKAKGNGSVQIGVQTVVWDSSDNRKYQK